MASWKKVIVSGSTAALSSLTLDTALPVAQGGTGATTLTDKAVLISQDSSTDTINSLALTGNGEIVVGGTGGPAVEAAADVAGTGLTAVVGDGTLAINVDASQTQITSVGTLGAGAISSGFGNIDNGTSTLNTGNTTVDNFTNNSAVASSHFTGSFSGSYTGDGSNLSGVALDIDGLGAETSLHQTQDHFVFSDNGTEKKITFSNLEDGIFGNVSGDITIAAGGASTIGADTVANSMLENMTQGTIKVGGGSNAPTDLDAKTDGQILIGDGTDINSVAVSGDVTIDNSGATTIAANTIGSNELKQNDDVTLQSLTLTGNLVVNGTQTSVNTTNLLVEDKFILLNSGSASGDGGLIVQTESAFSGSAFVYDDSESRFGFQIGTKLGDTATISVPDAYASSVVTSDLAAYRKNGNIRVQSGDIFIYVE
tara:strand:- start:119 stop:1396 length:1278 start_codon:yes stop_codon:yes gene_type:complete